LSIEQTYNLDTGKGPSLEEEAAAQDAAAAKAAEGKPNPDRPDWLPEQFKSVEDFVKSQQDGRAEITRLQQELAALKKTGEKPAAPTEEKPAEKPATEGDKPAAAEKAVEELTKAPVEEQQKAAEDALSKAGIDTTPFSDEFAKTGDVTEEGRAKIAEALKAQFGDQARALVDQFIDNSKAAATNYRNTAMQEAGGEDGYNAMTAWAKASMKPEEIAAYNKVVESGDINATLLAIRGLKQSYEKANGRVPNLSSGDNSAAPAADLAPFESAKQMVDAINDPRYKTDPAYRAQVAKRINAS
jgi:hypothetical protein